MPNLISCRQPQRRAPVFFLVASVAIGLGLLFCHGSLNAAVPQTTDTPSASAVPEKPAYAVTDLGILPLLAGDVTLPVNAVGEVAGWHAASSGAIHAAVWTKTHLREFGPLPGYRTSVAHGLNAAGNVAGWMTTSPNPVDSGATVRGFFIHDGQTVLMPTLGGRDSRAYAINDRGQVAGDADVSATVRHAVLYERGVLKDLGALPGGGASAAAAISQTGTVAGYAEVPNHQTHACLWRADGIHDLGCLPNGRYSRAVAVNDAGVTVGYGDADVSSDAHAIIYADGALRDLGTLKSYPAAAYGINGHGDIVGTASISDSGRHACLWHAGCIEDLNALIPRRLGWTLLRAYAINDHGTITCVGRNHKKETHALLLSPIVSQSNP